MGLSKDVCCARNVFLCCLMLASFFLVYLVVWGCSIGGCKLVFTICSFLHMMMGLLIVLSEYLIINPFIHLCIPLCVVFAVFSVDVRRGRGGC